MKKSFFLILVLSFLTAKGTAQDIIVTNDGGSMKVFNIEVGQSAVFYQVENNKDAEVKRIEMSNVLIIKKQDGTQIIPNANNAETLTPKNANSPKLSEGQIAAAPKKNVKPAVASSLVTEKKRVKTFSAVNAEGQTLYFQILSETDKTLALIKDGKKEYTFSSCIIPDTVILDNQSYTVTVIGEKAMQQNPNLKYVSLPETLKRIEQRAFKMTGLHHIVFPSSLEYIGECAFFCSCLEELAIPPTVKDMGKYAFLYCGSRLSPGKNYAGYVSCLPPFVTERNSQDYGIDDSSVEAYNKSKGK